MAKWKLSWLWNFVKDKLANSGDDITIGGRLNPDSDLTRNMGSENLRWKFGHFERTRVFQPDMEQNTGMELWGADGQRRYAILLEGATEDLNIYNEPDNQNILKFDFSDKVFKAVHFYPYSNSGYNLGSSALRWNLGYINRIYLNNDRPLYLDKNPLYLEDGFAREGVLLNMLYFLFTNEIAFQTPVSAEYYDEDSAAWTAWTGEDFAAMTDMSGETSVAIDYTHKKCRFVFTKVGMSELSMIGIVANYKNSTGNVGNTSARLLIEFDTDSSFPAPEVGYDGTVNLNYTGITIVRLDNNGYNKSYIRITLEITMDADGAVLYIERLQLMRDRFDMDWINTVLPINWDSAASVLPMTDNSQDLGSATLRWANLYAVTVNQGDAVFVNDWRITEYDDNGEMIDGLIFRNLQGEEVLRITNEGLFFKGNKIA